MATALDIITSALRLAGVLAASEHPTDEDANDCLAVLNDMADSWNAERLAIFTTSATDFVLTPGKQSYTLGPGTADFVMTRPAQIDSMSSILTTVPTNPVEIPIPMWSVDEWQTKFPVKNVNSSFPLGCYDDGGFPLRTLNFWPIPQQANSVRVYSWQPLGAAALGDTVSYPPGYAEAIRYNLAVRLCAEFAEPVSATVQDMAIKSLARIKTMNAPDLTLKSDLAGSSTTGQRARADLFGIAY